MGAIVVQVNPMYQSQELAHMISIVHPRLFIGETKQRTKLSKYNLPSIYIDGETDDLATIIHNADIHRNVTTEITPAEDVAVIQFTGGTTGVPKGAMLTHANLVANVIQTFAFAKGTLVRPGEVFLGVSPFFHVLGMSSVMNQGIYAAATIVTMRRWRVQDGVRLINEHQPTYFPAVPTMYIGLLNYAKKHPVSFGNFKVMTGGGAPMPVEVIRGVEQLTGAVISEGYGLSEASPTTHRNPYHGLRKVGSIGVPLPSTECRIVDIDTGKDAHIGEAGELLIKGPQVMKGYWGEPEATEQQLKDGWLRTGDIATVDADGYFYIVGRKKEMVIGSGYNIYPNEVEDLLYAHEHVLEVSVYGVPDPYRGETLAASVVLTEGADTTAEQLIKWCIEHLAAYKVPEIIEFRSELPKTTVAKCCEESSLKKWSINENKRKRCGSPLSFIFAISSTIVGE